MIQIIYHRQFPLLRLLVNSDDGLAIYPDVIPVIKSVTDPDRPCLSVTIIYNHKTNDCMFLLILDHIACNLTSP